MQVRDYPYPVIGIEEVTISGRIVFAEQEAEERGKHYYWPLEYWEWSCSLMFVSIQMTELYLYFLTLYHSPLYHAEKREAVVHVDKPWADVVVQRKLPPLKYYYDFEMSMFPNNRSLLCIIIFLSSSWIHFTKCSLLWMEHGLWPMPGTWHGSSQQ